LISGAVEYVRRRPERRFLFLGLDNAGKTTSLEQLKAAFGQVQVDLAKIPPTIGFNNAKMEIAGVDAVFWDLGGHANFRVIWRKYYEEAQGIVFVVDSSDVDRLPEARDVLWDVLTHEKILKKRPKAATQSSDSKSSEGAPPVPLLILCNKTDKSAAVSTEKIAAGMRIGENSLNESATKFVPIAAREESCRIALKEAAEWLVEMAR